MQIVCARKYFTFVDHIQILDLIGTDKKLHFCSKIIA